MTKRYDVTALGEVLIDFTENGSSAQGNPMYEANPGGAPCNVLAMLQKFGHKTAFLGKVGEDIFGRRLEKVLKETGIDTAGLCTDPAVRTTLAFVEKKADGDRDFSFYRNPGADMMLRAEELREQILKDTRIFHFGTLSMTDEPVRSATRHAIETAKANGAILSFDPNIREPLWQSTEEAKRQTAYGMEVCDVLKISDNEIRWFTGEEDFDCGVDMLWREYHIPLILLSMGSGGSRAYCGSRRAEQPAFLQAGTIETTGAGDTFGACCLHYILEHGMAGLGTTELEEMLRFANAAASIVTTRRGALRVMPEPEEIQAFLV